MWAWHLLFNRELANLQEDSAVHTSLLFNSAFLHKDQAHLGRMSQHLVFMCVDQSVFEKMSSPTACLSFSLFKGSSDAFSLMIMGLILIIQLFPRSRCSASDSEQSSIIRFEDISISRESFQAAVDETSGILNMPANPNIDSLNEQLVEDEVGFMAKIVRAAMEILRDRRTGIDRSHLIDFFSYLNGFTIALVRKYGLMLDQETIDLTINKGFIDMPILYNAAFRMKNTHGHVITSELRLADQSPIQLKEYTKDVTALLCISSVLKNPNAYNEGNLTPVEIGSKDENGSFDDSGFDETS